MSRVHEIYQSKDNRDTRYRELKAEGRKILRRTATNVLLHPQYVADFQGPEKYDTGFGNTVYKTYFPKIYIVEEA